MNTALRQLRTADAVIDAIGSARIRAITDSSSNVVTNWRGRGLLAHSTYLIVTAELARIGYWAKPELWGIVSPKKSNGRKK
jgi:hypothetical protein